MKAFNEFHPALTGRTGLILLFAEKCSETPEPTSVAKPIS